MSEILFISHRIPFPPDRGDKIRSHHIVKRLARLAPVHIATFADDDLDMSEEVELATLARSYKLVRRGKPMVIAGIQALASRQPVSLTAFHDAALAAYVDKVLATRPISTIYVYSGQMGQYVPESFKGRVIADFVDVDSAKFEAYAAKKHPALRWVQSREAKVLREEEARLAARADVSLLISAAEAELFSDRLSSQERELADIRVLANGIDSESFDPAKVEAEARMRAFPYPRLIFTGQMDYAPNIEAAIRAATRILPLIRDKFPAATLHIVGRKPVHEIIALHELGGCNIWGRVDDIRPWLKAADMALVPLEIARGVQNKVLEAMAMALPVVLTKGAATGIGASHGRQLAIAESDEQLAAAAINLLQDPRLARHKGLAARKFVCDFANWQAALAPLSMIIGVNRRVARNAA
jgi:sugar transferase (PEP-CTERM/EpsH1 system associated)